ncbi:MAG: HlyC/CorC family transporter [Phycisphaerales bacterium]|nr:HlyC/CorC family transporter [Phycisphaerales bacterium]
MDPAIQSSASQSPLLIVMFVLLFGSAIASASETALLGLSRASRAKLRKENKRLGLAVDRLLANPRQLLLQVLLLNMVINVGYFIVTSILTLKAQTATERIVISVGSLFAIILIGEVFAKLAAVAVTTPCLRVIAPLHILLRQPLRPLIGVLERFFIVPGTRLLVSGPAPAPGITPKEMSILLSMGTNEGVIDASEEDLLASIVMLSQRRVEEIMRPRVDFTWIDADASYEQVIEACQSGKVSRFPVFEDGLDGTPIGMIDAKRYFAQHKPGAKPRDLCSPLLFIPEQATLDTLLTQLRNNAQTVAIAVDEHGTVAGLITLADIADQLLSGIADHNSTDANDIIMTGPATWSVPGRLAVHEWSTLFGGLSEHDDSLTSRARTLAGLIMHTLARVPVEGDQINLGSATLTVISMNDLVVETVEVTLNTNGLGADPDPSSGGDR